MIFTHQYVGDIFGPDPFLFNEEDFDKLTAEFADVGLIVEDIYQVDEVGNPQFRPLEEVLEEEYEITNTSIKLPFDGNGAYTPFSSREFFISNNFVAVTPGKAVVRK